MPWTNRSLPFLVRLGLSCLLLTTIGGFVASGMHLVVHHANRDEKPGLSIQVWKRIETATQSVGSNIEQAHQAADGAASSSCGSQYRAEALQVG